MNTKLRAATFFGIAFVLMAPYLAFVIYSMLRFPQDHMPVWFAYTALIWLAGAIVVLTFVARRMFKKNRIEDSPRIPGTSTKTKRAVWIMRIVGSYLIVVWSVFFIIGVNGTIEGKYAVGRAIPAGLFLLFFIGIFGWSIFRTFKSKI